MYSSGGALRKKKVKLVLDYEGILCNPALDFAWYSYKNLVSKETKEKFPEDLIKIFDEYDDVRWEREREMVGHSTGTTPLVCDCAAAYDDISDHELISLAQSSVQENPGVNNLIQFAQEKLETLSIVTNSYPALALTTSYKYEIPSTNVFTHGYQLPRKELDKLKRVTNDWRLMDMGGDNDVSLNDMSLKAEAMRRSPIESLKPKEELEVFLNKYLENCSNLLQAYNAEDNGTITSLKKNELKLFEKVKDRDLRKALKYIFLHEKAIMGGHRKVDVLKTIDLYGEGIVYLGDSIVDADAIRFSKYGFAVNCTNKHSLYDAKLNLVLSDFSALIPLLEDISEGKFEFNEAKNYENSDMKVFLPSEIKQNFDYVKSINNEFKQELKRMYKN